MNKIIICDVDDTIAQLSQDATTLCNSLTKRNVHPNDWHTYDVETIFSLPQEDYFNAAIKTKLLESLQPVYGAQDTLHGLCQSGYDVYYVTARSWHPDAYNVTLEWLRFHRFPILRTAYQDCLHIVPLGCNKATYVKDNINRDNVTIAVDDNPEQVKNYVEAKSGSKKLCDYTFLIDQPWNASESDLNLYRVKHITQLANPFIYTKQT